MRLRIEITIEVQSELRRGSRFSVTMTHELADPDYYEKKKLPQASMRRTALSAWTSWRKHPPEHTT